MGAEGTVSRCWMLDAGCWILTTGLRSGG
jgi:hypothetical protein